MARDLAPVVIYTYSRLYHLQQTITALQQNFLASKSVLYVVSDAAKSDTAKPLVNRIREYVDGISGFREVVRIYRDKNLGTPASIHNAEEQIVNDHGTVISMEDDNVSSRNYLDFLNGGLAAYWDDPQIFSICGYCPTIPIPAGFSSEYWFHHWNMSWGYALWKHKYYKVYPLANPYPEFKRKGMLRKVRAKGGLCITDAMMLDYRKKRIYPDSVLCAKMMTQDLCSVIPTVSKIRNIGSDGTGVSGSLLSERYHSHEDNRSIREFGFAGKPAMNDSLVAETVKFYNGRRITRLTRRLGIYHELSSLKYWLQHRLIAMRGHETK